MLVTRDGYASRPRRGIGITTEVVTRGIASKLEARTRTPARRRRDAVAKAVVAQRPATVNRGANFVKRGGIERNVANRPVHGEAIERVGR